MLQFDKITHTYLHMYMNRHRGMFGNVHTKRLIVLTFLKKSNVHHIGSAVALPFPPPTALRLGKH